MRSLYFGNAVDSSVDATVARKFTKLRDDTRQDAIVYLKCILPITTKFIMSIKEYFEHYEALSYEEWCKMLSDICEEAKTNKEVAQAVLGMYENIMVTLKKREDQAEVLMKEFTSLEQEYKRQQKEFEDSAKSKEMWAFALAFVPGVNLVASPLLAISANEDASKAGTKKNQADAHEAATLAVAEVLIPALSHFIKGLTIAAGFFDNMEKELESFKGKAAKSTTCRKKVHYKMMREKAKEIKSACQSFYTMLPDVRTNFESIPNEETDQDYADNWLKRQLVEIKTGKAKKFLLNVFNEAKPSKNRCIIL